MEANSIITIKTLLLVVSAGGLELRLISEFIR